MDIKLTKVLTAHSVKVNNSRKRYKNWRTLLRYRLAFLATSSIFVSVHICGLNCCILYSFYDISLMCKD